MNNARAFEALLTAISLRSPTELEKDAQAIERRHACGEMSDAKYTELKAVITTARSGEWAAAEAQAYEFRAQFGDEGSFFK